MLIMAEHVLMQFIVEHGNILFIATQKKLQNVENQTSYRIIPNLRFWNGQAQIQIDFKDLAKQSYSTFVFKYFRWNKEHNNFSQPSMVKNL